MELTVRLPPFVELAVHADRLPLSKPSAKIRSGRLDVGEGVNVGVEVDVGPCVGVSVGVGVSVAVGVMVGVGVSVGVGPNVGVLVRVFVGVAVGIGPSARKLKASTSLLENPQVLPSRYRVVE